jgi:cytochrome c5
MWVRIALESFNKKGKVMKLALLGFAASTALLMTSQVIASQALAADGKAVYNKSCAVCHAALSPKLGDKAAWEPRLKQGADGLVASVLKGQGAMPAKGGNTTLSEADIRAAVEYMLAQLK